MHSEANVGDQLQVTKQQPILDRATKINQFAGKYKSRISTHSPLWNDEQSFLALREYYNSFNSMADCTALTAYLSKVLSQPAMVHFAKEIFRFECELHKQDLNKVMRQNTLPKYCLLHMIAPEYEEFAAPLVRLFNSLPFAELQKHEAELRRNPQLLTTLLQPTKTNIAQCITVRVPELLCVCLQDIFLPALGEYAPETHLYHNNPVAFISHLILFNFINPQIIAHTPQQRWLGCLKSLFDFGETQQPLQTTLYNSAIRAIASKSTGTGLNSRNSASSPDFFRRREQLQRMSEMRLPQGRTHLKRRTVSTGGLVKASEEQRLQEIPVISQSLSVREDSNFLTHNFPHRTFLPLLLAVIETFEFDDRESECITYRTLLEYLNQLSPIQPRDFTMLRDFYDMQHTKSEDKFVCQVLSELTVKAIANSQSTFGSSSPSPSSKFGQ